MDEKLLNKIKLSSEKAQITPPTRVWNRLEYKLDRFDFEKKKNRTSRFIYASSVAAVFIFIISLIFVLKSDTQKLSINDKSNIIVEGFHDNNTDYQVYNVHALKNYYSKLKNENQRNKFYSLKVNHSPKG